MDYDEKEMPDNYAIYGDYAYVAVLEDGTEKVVRSHLMRGTASDLIRDLRCGMGFYKGKLAIRFLKTCDLIKRNVVPA